jgi:hypothetical protein
MSVKRLSRPPLIDHPGPWAPFEVEPSRRHLDLVWVAVLASVLATWVVLAQLAVWLV